MFSSPSSESAEDLSSLLLVLGVQRSGTTLLAAMLGRHSEVSMLFESSTDDVLRLMGKRYRGNKLTTRQIDNNKRASKTGHLMNRLVNMDLNPVRPRYHKRKTYPMSTLSVVDYMQMGASIICIERNESDVVSSIVNRTPMTKGLAETEYRKGMEQMRALTQNVCWVNFDDLVQNPQGTMLRVCSFLGLDFEERMLDGSRFNVVYPQETIIAEKASGSENR